ncbi:unnamed protein product [Pleuronectes platessa]|uniref:Nucleotide-binding oligomerization domain-containing protein 2 n=1 Tax=Pleuronectes platessa TaxID=8262 RepID=A0A9N7Z747_PLEPL|nr:unnamed protein product [Pleuronectes platessa]
MFAQELVLKQRTEILHALCSSGSAELLERVLDLMLAQGELVWEEYQNVQVPGRALYTNARHLLDLVYTKGVDTCEIFLAAFKQVVPEGQGTDLHSSGCCVDLEKKDASQISATQTLLIDRPSLVSNLQDCIDGALEALTVSGNFTSADCDDVQLPIHTPSQQARCLLDHIRSKGESAAKVVLHHIQQQGSGASRTQEKLTPPKELFKYQKKLSSSVSAQSCFLSTYGGTSNMSLEDIYTECQLELAHECADAHGPLHLEDIIGAAGTVNEEADTVLVSGEAGSGKSTLLQRLHLLWARGAALQEFLLLFPFSCRRLNSEHRELSVQELLFQHCCWPDKEQEEIFQFILDHPHLTLFTFDGLDELKQSFSDEHRLCCPTQRAPVQILLFNLLQGSLMKGVWKVVTSRPEAVGPLLRKHLRKEVFLKALFTAPKHPEECHGVRLASGAPKNSLASSHTDRATIVKLFEPQDTRETSQKGQCFGACLPATAQQEQTQGAEASAAKTTNLQITATFVSGLLSPHHRSLWLYCCPSSVMEKRIKQVSRCLSKGMQKHFKSIPQPVAGEKKSMHAMPGFVWLIKCIYEMQENRIAKDAISKLDVDHLKLTYCDIGPVECTALAYVLQHLRRPVGSSWTTTL